MSAVGTRIVVEAQNINLSIYEKIKVSYVLI